MAPRNRKIAAATTPETAEAGIKEIIDTPVEKTLEEAAAYVNTPVFNLQNIFCDRLGNDGPQTWETIPTAHEPLLDEFKRQMDAAATVQPYAPQLPSQPEPPVVEEEPKPVKHSKRKSSALTQKKTKAIEKGREATQQTQQGVTETLARLQAQAGIKDAANAGTTYLQAFQATLNQVKGQGLTVIGAEMIRDLSCASGFSPDEILADYGVNISADTQEALMEQLAPMLGKSQAATQEILETAWGNGIDLSQELTQLDSLMSLDD